MHGHCLGNACYSKVDINIGEFVVDSIAAGLCNSVIRELEEAKRTDNISYDILAQALVSRIMFQSPGYFPSEVSSC